MKKKDRDSIVTVTREPHLELIGCSECVVDGLKGILEYGDDRIKINLGKYYATIFGDGLYIDSFSYEGAVIRGTIVSVELDGNA